jgi:hypothetical protein
MSINYTWGINYLETKTQPDANGLQQVVTSTQWTCTANDGTFTTSTTGYGNFQSPNPQTFVQYSSLTANTVLGWVFAEGLNQQQVQENLANTLTSMHTPATVYSPLPWSTSTATANT